MTEEILKGLFGVPLVVANLGMSGLAAALRSQNAPVVEIDWRPPLEGVPSLRHTRGHIGPPIKIEDANIEACRRIKAARPMLVGMAPALEVIPGMHKQMILHAGPPIPWQRMSGAMRGAVIGALVYEGLARDENDAAALAASDEIELSSCHEHNAAGSLAGIISAHMPVFVVQNRTSGSCAYAPVVEAKEKALRFGAYGPEVYDRLRWVEQTLFPAMNRALRSLPGGVDMNNLIVRALQMGDECHSRNEAAFGLFLREILPALVRQMQPEIQSEVLEFLTQSRHFFLNVILAAARVTLMAAEGVPGSTILTSMARNGVDFGICMAGEPGQWFTAPVSQARGHFKEGYNAEQASSDMGDCSIIETLGLGAFSMAAAPAVMHFANAEMGSSLELTGEMYEITFSEHELFRIPAMGFRGAPLGIDVRRVVKLDLYPCIFTGIAHKDPGMGMVGAGLVHAPRACFTKAFEAVTTW